MTCLQINVFIFLILNLMYCCHSFIIGEKELLNISTANLSPPNKNSLPTFVSTTTEITSSSKQCGKDEFEAFDIVPSSKTNGAIKQLAISRNAESVDYGTANSGALQDNSKERHLITSPADKDVVEVRDKRSSDKSVAKRRIPKGKQKKAKALGRLLMSSAADKLPEDPSDDYLGDDDDDYSMGLNGEKMNWEDYRNEDGSSVLELIALNARHKTRMQRAHGDEYLYR